MSRHAIELRPLRGIANGGGQQVEGVTVQGQGFSDEAVRAAVDEAGYEVLAA